MYVFMNELKNGWMDSWMDDGLKNGQIVECMHGWMGGWMEGWMDGRKVVDELVSPRAASPCVIHTSSYCHKLET